MIWSLSDQDVSGSFGTLLRRRRVFWALCFVAGVGGMTHDALGGEPHRWSDSTGAVSFKGVLLATDGDWVRIRQEDGAVIRVPLAWLSKRDQQYARRGDVAARNGSEHSAIAPQGQDGDRQMTPPARVVNVAEALGDHIDLPPRDPELDSVVEKFIAYDIGQLRGREGTEAREAFSQLGTESVGPLIRGLNEAARLGHSCPVVVLRSKLSNCLAAASDPRLNIMAACNLCKGVPRSAPHYRSVDRLKRQCISRLPVSHRLRQQQARIDKLEDGKDDAAIDQSLRSKDPIERLAAVTVAASLGPRYASELIAALNDADPEVRQAAHGGLVSLGRGVDFGPDEPAPASVRRAAVDNWSQWYEQQVRFAVPRQAWRASRQQLRRALETGGEEGKIAALLVIRYQRHRMFQDLVKLFHDPSYAVRREARETLSALADGVDLGPDDFSDPAEVEAAAASWELWEVRRRSRVRNRYKTEEKIREEMASGEDEVRLAAVASAAERSLPCAEQFIHLLDDGVPEIRQAAREGLVELAGGTDFGPATAADTVACKEAIRQWTQWLQKKSAGDDVSE